MSALLRALILEQQQEEEEGGEDEAEGGGGGGHGGDRHRDGRRKRASGDEHALQLLSTIAACCEVVQYSLALLLEYVQCENLLLHQLLCTRGIRVCLCVCAVFNPACGVRLGR